VWSKAGRFVNGLHTVGDIITKISNICVIKLHASLLFTCHFYVFILCMVIIVSIFMGISWICCMCMFTEISV
jgi:hypothetical protein